MTTPLRILHLDCTRGQGGQEKDHIHEACEFRRRGHIYWIGARPDTFLLRIAQKKDMALSLPMRSNFDLFSFLTIRRFLKSEKIDILVTTSYIDAVLGWFAALSLGGNRPVVVRQRHLLNPPKGMLPFRRFCDFIVAVSDIARFGYIERKIPFWKVVAIPRGIPEPGEGKGPSPSPSTDLPDNGRHANDRVILQIGTFQRDKGQLPLLEALRPHLAMNPSLHLVLLGEGPLRPNVERRLASERFADVKDRIHLPGFANPVPYYQRASVLAVSSFREAYSLVILEAFSHELPVVGFRQGGVIEAFSRGNFGELVPPWNFPLLAERTVAWALRDLPPGGGAARFLPGSFDIARSVERTESFYRWALERKKAGELGKNLYETFGGRIDPFARTAEKIKGAAEPEGRAGREKKEREISGGLDGSR